MESKNKKGKELCRAHFQQEHILIARILQGNSTLFLEKHIKNYVEKRKKNCRKKKKLFILLPVKGRCLNHTIISDVLKYSQHLCRKHAAGILISSSSDLCILSLPV